MKYLAQLLILVTLCGCVTTKDQKLGNPLSHLGVKGVTETGGSSEYHRYLIVLDDNGKIAPNNIYGVDDFDELVIELESYGPTVTNIQNDIILHAISLSTFSNRVLVLESSTNLWNTALQPGDNISELNNDLSYLQPGDDGSQLTGITPEQVGALPVDGTAVGAYRLYDQESSNHWMVVSGATGVLYEVEDAYDTNTIVIVDASAEYNGPPVGTELEANGENVWGATNSFEVNYGIYTATLSDTISGDSWNNGFENFEMPFEVSAYAGTATGAATLDWRRYTVTNATVLASTNDITTAIAALNLGTMAQENRDNYYNKVETDDKISLATNAVSMWSQYPAKTDVDLDGFDLLAGDDRLNVVLGTDTSETFAVHTDNAHGLQKRATTVYGIDYSRLSRWFEGSEWTNSAIRAEFGPCPDMDAMVYCPYSDADTGEYHPLKIVSIPGKRTEYGYYSVAITVSTNGDVIIDGNLDMQGWEIVNAVITNIASGLKLGGDLDMNGHSILNVGVSSIHMIDGKVISSNTISEWDKSADLVQKTEIGGLLAVIASILGYVCRIIRKRTGIDILKYAKVIIKIIEEGGEKK